MSETGIRTAVRLLDARDLPAVDAVMLAAFDPIFGEAWTSGQCLATFALPGYVWLGAGGSGPGSLAGFALFRTIANESELLLLAVDPSHRSRGVGSSLIAAWLANCNDAKVSRCFLEVRADNLAHDLYLRSGFENVARRANYYRGADGILRDAITMQYRRS